MTELEAVLDRLVADAPVDRADWGDVIGRAIPPRRARVWSGRRGAALAGFAVTAAVVVALVPTWGSEASFAGRAMAAIGSDRYVRVEVEPPDAPFASVVDLATGRSRPAKLQRVYWYDSRTAAFRVWNYVDGVPVSTGDLAGGNTGLAAFLGGYRTALADGTAELAGKATDRGRAVELIRFDASGLAPAPSVCAGPCTSYLPGTTIDVAVDHSSYRPVWFRLNEMRLVEPATATQPAKTVTKSGPLFRIHAIAGFPTTAERPPALPDIRGEATDVSQLTRAQAAGALGVAPLWPAGRVGGLALRSAELQHVMSYRDVTGPVTAEGPGLHLVYGTGRRSIEIREAAKPQAAYGFTSPTLGNGPLAPPGGMRITCFACGRGLGAPVWTGQLRERGLYVDLSAPSRSLLLAAARALVAGR